MNYYPKSKPEWLVKHLNAKREARLQKRREAYQAKKRLEQIREALRFGNASYQDLIDLADMRAHISWKDAELLEPAGIPEDVYNLMNGETDTKNTAYSIYVDNVGEVDTFKSKKEAVKEYLIWIEESDKPYGRASGESVYLFRNGEPVCEYLKNNETEGVTK
jgi:hypothetical protein